MQAGYACKYSPFEWRCCGRAEVGDRERSCSAAPQEVYKTRRNDVPRSSKNYKCSSSDISSKAAFSVDFALLSVR